MRSRVSICGFLPLLTVVTLSAQVAAQESPEFGDDAPLEAEPLSVEEAPVAMEASAPVDDTERTETEQGYSSGAPETQAAPVVEVEAPLTPDMRAAAELGVFATSKSAGRSRLTLSPILTFGVGVSEAIEVGATWGLNFQSDGASDVPMSDGESTMVLGNPMLWVARRSQDGDTQLNFGGGIALPVASMPEDVADQMIAASAYVHASAIRGDWNQWLWTPDRATAVLNFAGHAVMDELLFGGEGAIAMLIPVDAEGQAAFGSQLAGEVGYATDDVRVVMRAQAVVTITPAVEDALQFSLDPYVAWNASESVTLTGRWTVNLDNPTGFDGLRIWGLRLGANVNL